MQDNGFDVVTGAFGYTGRYITRHLLAKGRRVATITRRPQPAGIFEDHVPTIAAEFDIPDALAEQMRGADTLYNTYWIRFPHAQTTYEQAVHRSLTLFQAARMAGVRRVIHISIAHASPDSVLPYYSGKGRVEEGLRASGLNYAILRPTLVFGAEDILVNNIAWFLRRFPIFGVPGAGDYPVQPVAVEDIAKLAISAAENTDDHVVLEAAGPETYTFTELVHLIARAIGSTARIVPLPPSLALQGARLVGLFVRDVVLTADEAQGLMAGLLASDSAPTCETRFSQWMQEHARELGREYRSELQAHY